MVVTEVGVYRFKEPYEDIPKGRVFQVIQVEEDVVRGMGREFPKEIPVEKCND